MALSIWRTPQGDARESKVMQRHEQLAGINETLGEYAELLEGVSTERAHLLKTISELQLKNAELAVGKALYADLELELAEMRKVSQQAVDAVAENRKLKSQLAEAKRENAEFAAEARFLRQENGVLKGQLTKLRNKEGNHTPQQPSERSDDDAS